MQDLKDQAANGYCAMTTDMWTDDYRKLSYLSLTVHYIDDEWNLKERVLSTKHFEESHTAVHIRTEVIVVFVQNLCNVLNKQGWVGYRYRVMRNAMH